MGIVKLKKSSSSCFLQFSCFRVCFSVFQLFVADKRGETDDTLDWYEDLFRDVTSIIKSDGPAQKKI
jgi:hypothetical protein